MEHFFTSIFFNFWRSIESEDTEDYILVPKNQIDQEDTSLLFRDDFVKTTEESINSLLRKKFIKGFVFGALAIQIINLLIITFILVYFMALK